MSTKVRHRAGKTGSIFKSLIALLLAIVLVLALGVGALKTGFGRSLLTSGLTKITSTGIGGSFEDIAELSVEEYNFTNVGKYDQSGIRMLGRGVPLSGKSFLLTYDGVVKAGIEDMSKVKVDVDDSARVVNLSAPEVKITSATIDPASIVVYDQSMNPFNQFKVEDLTQFLTVETDNAKKKATENGLMDKAKVRSEELLKSHVKAVTEGSDKADYEVRVNWRG